ncbi:hypothetical protein [Bradyrhizobium tropiciagri]|uniref:hypothetical protein n=1 Tax=Bradyrhizobium tropiciagri TaxID=312253 RepID=UPI000AA06411|nr:hypothetical protein [Bradyrhizobium tropiciagri]
MRLARFILINATVMPLMLGNAGAANINVAVTAPPTEPAKIAAGKAVGVDAFGKTVFNFASRQVTMERSSGSIQRRSWQSFSWRRPQDLLAPTITA